MKIRVFVIVKKEKKILLIKESNPKYKKKWHIPGGTMRENENLVQAGIRETMEEAGYNIAINGVYYIRYVPRPVSEKGLYIYCTGRVISGKAKKIADEHSIESDWFDFATMEKMELRGNLLEILYKSMDAMHVIPSEQLDVTAKQN